tara:strand:+ start:50289 stop:50720 length:432 start_codon:yes stop_codon:yes gene_type:complete
VSESIEFSEFFRILNSIKEGEVEKKKELEEKMKEFKLANNAKNYLDELGQRFLYLGIKELYIYTKTQDLEFIVNIDKAKWDNLAEENKEQLPQHLANTMITNIKDNELSKELGSKWKVKPREINKHVMPMARYITEGIIEFLE